MRVTRGTDGGSDMPLQARRGGEGIRNPALRHTSADLPRHPLHMRLGDPRADLDNIQNFALTGIRSSDCPAHSGLLCRLHYSGRRQRTHTQLQETLEGPTEGGVIVIH